ncbi:MAG: hypothetical protein ACYDCL_20045 [Myxococcales bacterium]
MNKIAAFVALLALPGAGLARAQSAGPTIDHTPVTQATAGQPLTIAATIHSSSGVFQPVVLFRHPGEATWRKQELLAGTNGSYAMTLPGNAVDRDLEYYLEAYDDDGNGPGRAGSPDSPFHVAVVAGVAQPAPEAAVTALVETPSPGGWMPPAGWTGVGVGGAAIVVGAALLVIASNGLAAAQADPTAAGAFSKSQTAGGENTAGIVTLVAGGVVAIAGAALLLLPHGHHVPPSGTPAP